MTLQRNEQLGQDAALQSLGLSKEAMEKVAILGLGLRLGRGLGLAANRVANVGRRMIGRGPSGFGLQFANKNARNLQAMKLKDARRMNRMTANLKPFDVTKRVKTNPDALLAGKRRAAVGLGSGSRAAASTPTMPGVMRNQVATAPRLSPGATAAYNTGRVGPTAAGAKTTTGAFPGVMQGGAKATPTMPGAGARYTRVTGAQGAPFRSQVPTRPVAPIRPTTPTMPAGPLTDQQKVYNWMRQNPILAGAGGLLGYNMLGNRGQGNVVVTR